MGTRNLGPWTRELGPEPGTLVLGAAAWAGPPKSCFQTLLTPACKSRWRICKNGPFHLLFKVFLENRKRKILKFVAPRSAEWGGWAWEAEGGLMEMRTDLRAGWRDRWNGRSVKEIHRGIPLG